MLHFKSHQTNIQISKLTIKYNVNTLKNVVSMPLWMDAESVFSNNVPTLAAQRVKTHSFCFKKIHLNENSILFLGIMQKPYIFCSNPT